MGQFWAVLGRIAHPQPHFGLIADQNRDLLAASWATWLQSQFRGHFSQVQSPTFLRFPTLRMTQTGAEGDPVSVCIQQYPALSVLKFPATPSTCAP